MLTLRLLPLACSIAAVAGLCLPSYLWFEPAATREQVGWMCLIAALLGVATLATSIGRAVHATLRSWRYTRRCWRVATKTSLEGQSEPVWVMEGSAPFLALAGILRPRLLISRGALNRLSSPQLSVALRHEAAHRASGDNLKRLVIALAPGVWPFFRGFDLIEKSWARFTEWAADEAAVLGDPMRSVLLADALVRVAGVGSAAQRSPLLAPLLADGSELKARVERLLHPVPPAGVSTRRIAAAAFGATAMLVAIVAQPWTLRIAYRFLEDLIH
ncbi:MAG: M56 family metallopeptidase [Acidobacteriia bacterium]|nr:M56 family metallopeptidase [Terriglobia bacterium]